MANVNASTTSANSFPFAFLAWRIKGVGKNIACLGVEVGQDRQLATNYSKADHASLLASRLTIKLASAANTDATYDSPWEVAKPEDNVFDLEIQV